MKKNIYIIFGLLALSTTIYSFMPKATGSHPSSTGAPGELTCASSNCHSDAMVNTGDIANSHSFKDSNGNDVTYYQPGETYTISISVTDANSSKFGFQVTSLDSSDNYIGQLVVTDGNRTQLQPNSDPSSLNREYITHTFGGNSEVSPGVGSWSMDWTAPANNSGDITFYYCTNATNSNGQNTGDALYLSNFTISEYSQPNSIPQIGKQEDIKVSVRNRKVRFNYYLNSSENVLIKVTHLSGKQLTSRNHGKLSAGEHISTVDLDNSLPAGIYLATIFVGNQHYSEKIIINQ